MDKLQMLLDFYGQATDHHGANKKQKGGDFGSCTLPYRHLQRQHCLIYTGLKTYRQLWEDTVTSTTPKTQSPCHIFQKQLTLIQLGWSLDEEETQTALLMNQNNAEQMCEEEQLKTG